jgi:hypothetical protein
MYLNLNLPFLTATTVKNNILILYHCPKYYFNIISILGYIHPFVKKGTKTF